MELIHEKSSFTEENIRERAERYGFSDLLPLELFLWDCEITAQLQLESDKLVLKGGTAVQLHLPVEVQRGSVDIDFTCPLNKQELHKIVSKVERRLNNVQFKLHEPKHPKLNLPLVTYYVKVPVIASTETRKDLEIKTEFLLEDFRVPTLTVSQIETFAVKTKSLKCYSPTALIGDKLLTLAEKTIGIQRQEDIPKQIYDITQLSKRYISSTNDFSEILEVMKLITPKEASYRDLNLDLKDILKDIYESMEKYSLVDTAGADTSLKHNITNFQQFYVSGAQRMPWYEWCVRALRIKFSIQLLTNIIEHKLTLNEAVKTYSTAIEIARTLGRASGTDINKIRRRLMELADNYIPYYRELRGKPLHRVFWQILTIENLDEIQKEIQT
jgi:predicted nucleotidyltransferase component of viral defense system